MLVPDSGSDSLPLAVFVVTTSVAVEVAFSRAGEKRTPSLHDVARQQQLVAALVAADEEVVGRLAVLVGRGDLPIRSLPEPLLVTVTALAAPVVCAACAGNAIDVALDAASVPTAPVSSTRSVRDLRFQSLVSSLFSPLPSP